MKSNDNKFSEFLYTQYDVVKEKIERTSELHRYSNKTLINQGSQKKIYKVYDSNCSREIAMAVLISDSEEENAQFLREGKITALLQHPNIMPVYETGVGEDQKPYFTMQLGKGKSLQDILESDTKLSLQDKLEIFLKVCDALIYAHSKGIIHRDLKPDNIYIGQFGEVLLCDWGLAKILFADCDESLLDDQSLSQVDLKVSLKGYIKGTPGYIAPEIIKDTDYSVQSDIFALGALLHKLLTGNLPFNGQSVEDILSQTKNNKYTLFEGKDDQTSQGLKAISRKALDFEKSQRYQKIKDLSTDIKSYLNGFSPEAEDASLTTQMTLFYKRNQLICKLVFLFILSLFAVTSIFISSIQQKEDKAVKLLNQLQESDLKRKRAEANLIPIYLAKAKDAFLNGQPETALTLAEVTYNFDRSSKEIKNIYGKSLMSMQMFSKASKILQTVNPELAKISADFAL
ncbi:MAG: serine/threonine protein kinase, partial [Lentisphaeraceae bacterium]|nr:serine/threonine protein kinase [Lentisphaeraceae bacterium]